MINLKGITKVYGNKDLKYSALNSIDLQINEGEIVAITGPSGSGKSTLLNIIGCLDTATSGEYFLNNKDINKYNKKEIAKIRNTDLGFVFQNFALMNNYTVLENIELALKYNKKYKGNNYGTKERKARGIAALEMVGLAKLCNKLPSQLSGGQQQRVAIARALVNNPQILLADEPTGSLDKANGEQILDIFKKIHNAGKTVIIVTHDPEVAKICSKNIVVSDGKILDIVQ
jgi:putative ABC transport system ATP-binding protein